MILIFEASKLRKDFCKTIFVFFLCPISPWSRPRSKSLFWAFFLGMVYIFIIQKVSFEWDRLQAFLNIDHDYENICFLKKLRNKFGTKFGSWSSQKVQNFLFGGLNESEISAYFGPLFVLVKTLLDALTNRAMFGLSPSQNHDTRSHGALRVSDF